MSNNIIRIPKDQPITVEQALLFVNQYGSATRYTKLQNYYEGQHDILYRSFEDTTKPNNKLINNFSSYITDVRTGYFTGVPITYSSEDTNYLAKLREVFQKNDEQDVSSELDKISNIKGHAYELHWVDEEGNPRFKQVNPDEILMVYSADVEEKPIYAIRHWSVTAPDNKTITKFIDIYNDSYIMHYKVDKYGKKDANITDCGIEEHHYGELPVIEYLNNAERMSSFEDEIPLIDGYNLATSDSVNEIAYFNDAYLKGKNLSATEPEDLQKMKENRVLLVEGDGDVEWLTKNINDTYLENIKDRIAKDIHKFSKTPNLVSDEFISNLSGTAIRYKVWGLEQDTAQKERKWQKAIAKRIKLITNILNIKGASFNPLDIKVVFNRNLPQNVIELSQMCSQLTGIVSKETLLSQLPFVSDVKEELKRVEDESGVNADTFGFDNTANTDGMNAENMKKKMESQSNKLME